MSTQLTIPNLFGPNKEKGQTLTNEINELEVTRRRTEVAIGNRLLEARTLILINYRRLGKADKLADRDYFDWARTHVGYARTKIYELERIAKVWKGTPEEVVDKFTIGALTESSKRDYPIEAREMAIAQAESGEKVNLNNVVQFRQRTEIPHAKPLIEVLFEDEPAPTRTKAQIESDNMELIGLNLSAAEDRVDILEDFIFRVLSDPRNSIDQDYLDEAIKIEALDTYILQQKQREVERYATTA